MPVDIVILIFNSRKQAFSVLPRDGLSSNAPLSGTYVIFTSSFQIISVKPYPW